MRSGAGAHAGSSARESAPGRARRMSVEERRLQNEELTPVRAIFVFTADQDLLAFPSLQDAAGYLEAVDVEAAEYPAIYTDQGNAIEASAAGQTVVLTDTGRTDSSGLTFRIRR